MMVSVISLAAQPQWGMNDVGGTSVALLPLSPSAAVALLAQNGVTAKAPTVHGLMATVKSVDDTVDAVIVSVRLLMRDGSRIDKVMLLTSRTNAYLSGMALTDGEIDRPLSITIFETVIRRRASL